MDKKLMIYPFNKWVSTIARCAGLLKGYELTAAVSPKSYGYDGKDISFVDGGAFAGIKISSSFQEGLNVCDCVLFSASTFRMNISYYEEKIQEAVSDGKEALITKELLEEFAENKKDIPAGVRVLGVNPVESRISYHDQKYIKEISVPVLSIFSVGKFCSGLETQLVLGERFEKAGYRVSKVTSSIQGELFGIHMMPDYIYKNNISVEDKIVNFNRYIASIVKEEKPNIIIIETEEAILPYNDRITNHFGTIPSIVSTAVRADVSILNLYSDVHSPEYFEHLKYYCKYKLNAEVNYMNLANAKLIIDEFSTVDPISYVSVNKDAVMEVIRTHYDDNDFAVFFNLYDLDSVEGVYTKIINELSGNKEVVRIW